MNKYDINNILWCSVVWIFLITLTIYIAKKYHIRGVKDKKKFSIYWHGSLFHPSCWYFAWHDDCMRGCYWIECGFFTVKLLHPKCIGNPDSNNDKDIGGCESANKPWWAP